jgi:hypothetical protein
MRFPFSPRVRIAGLAVVSILQADNVLEAFVKTTTEDKLGTASDLHRRSTVPPGDYLEKKKETTHDN